MAPEGNVSWCVVSGGETSPTGCSWCRRLRSCAKVENRSFQGERMAILGRGTREGNINETEKPAHTGTTPRPPDWLVKLVEAIAPPGLRLGNSIIGIYGRNT